MGYYRGPRERLMPAWWYDGPMDVKRLPWVPGVMQDLGLEDLGGGFYSSPDGLRSIYLGLGSAVFMTQTSDLGLIETQHEFPAWPDAGWLLSCATDHGQELVARAMDADPRWN